MCCHPGDCCPYDSYPPKPFGLTVKRLWEALYPASQIEGHPTVVAIASISRVESLAQSGEWNSILEWIANSCPKVLCLLRLLPVKGWRDVCARQRPFTSNGTRNGQTLCPIGLQPVTSVPSPSERRNQSSSSQTSAESARERVKIRAAPVTSASVRCERDTRKWQFPSVNSEKWGEPTASLWTSLGGYSRYFIWGCVISDYPSSSGTRRRQ